MSLLSFPNELLLTIADFLTPRDISSFLRVNRHMNHILTPLLHRIALQDIKGIPALHYAAIWGHESLVRLLLKKGVDVNFGPSVRDVGETALTRAVSYRRHNIVKLLLENGADTSIPGYGGLPIHTAARHGSLEILSMLLESGADISLRLGSGLASETALLTAVSNQRYSAVKMLLESGADVNGADTNGWTALHKAAYFSSKAITRLLLENGADISLLDIDRRTALHLAACSEFHEGDHAVVNLLLEMGADAVAQDINGVTPLIVAIEASQRMPLLDFQAIIMALEGAEFFKHYSMVLEQMSIVGLGSDTVD